MVAKAQVEDFLDAGAGVEHENEQCARFPYLKWRILRCPSLAPFGCPLTPIKREREATCGTYFSGGNLHWGYSVGD